MVLTSERVCNTIQYPFAGFAHDSSSLSCSVYLFSIMSLERTTAKFFESDSESDDTVAYDHDPEGEFSVAAPLFQMQVDSFIDEDIEMQDVKMVDADEGEDVVMEEAVVEEDVEMEEVVDMMDVDAEFW